MPSELSNILGSATAGSLARLLCHPIDTCKSRLQCEYPAFAGKNTLSVFLSTYRSEGKSRLIKHKFQSSRFKPQALGDCIEVLEQFLWVAFLVFAFTCLPTRQAIPCFVFCCIFKLISFSGWNHIFKKDILTNLMTFSSILRVVWLLKQQAAVYLSLWM